MPDCAVTLKEDKCTYCSPGEEQRSTFKITDMVHNDNEGMTIDKIKELTRTKTGKYDCLVGTTGGRDSTYLLYYTKEILGLNPLAVNFDTGFMTDIVVTNMQNTTSILGVDFMRYKIDWKFFQKLLRGFFLNYGEFCSVCHQGHIYSISKFAKDNGIPVIFRGISSKTDINRIDPHFADYFCKSEQDFNDKIRGFAREEGITDEELEYHKDFLNIQSWADKEIKTIDLPDLLDYDYRKIQEVLTKKFNWQHPPGQWIHGDCMLHPVLVHTTRCSTGYSEKQYTVSNLLIHGDIDIERGKELLLAEENISVYELPDFDKILNIFNIDRAAFEKTVETHWKKSC